jgi:hypothetical protein
MVAQLPDNLAANARYFIRDPFFPVRNSRYGGIGSFRIPSRMI